jgi:glutamine cyclotransferase
MAAATITKLFIFHLLLGSGAYATMPLFCTISPRSQTGNSSLFQLLGIGLSCLRDARMAVPMTKRALKIAVSCWLFVLTGYPANRTLSGQSIPHTAPSRAPEYTFKVIQVFPHDSAAFTQGLFYRDGFLYEGTGLNGRSSLRRVRLETGEVLQRIDLAPEFFGEGIAVLGNKIVQLTWQSQTGFVYNSSDFRLLRRFSYRGEGWGLTTNGTDFFMSDGTSEIRVLDGATLREKRLLRIRDGGTPINQLNELEFVDGEIFANVWQTDRIARISPRTGRVVGWIDLTGLLSSVYKLEEGGVLNGIAYDAAKKRLFVTGKLWPSVFEIQIVKRKT